MITVRPADQRGHQKHGWLDSHHTFSFADYYDAQHMGFRALRVINEDRVLPAQGFGSHSHRDMEIISYVLEGALEHKDSLGTGSIIRPGDVQRMSAGSGVSHSEFNASQSDPVHFLQIWLTPAVRGIKPSYEQKNFSSEDKRAKLRLVASADGREGSLTIHTDASIYAGLFSKGEQANLTIAPDRHVWVQVARGRVRVNDRELNSGDGISLSAEPELRIEGAEPEGEVIVFELA